METSTGEESTWTASATSPSVSAGSRAAPLQRRGELVRTLRASAHTLLELRCSLGKIMELGGELLRSCHQPRGTITQSHESVVEPSGPCMGHSHGLLQRCCALRNLLRPGVQGVDLRLRRRGPGSEVAGIAQGRVRCCHFVGDGTGIGFGLRHVFIRGCRKLLQALYGGILRELGVGAHQIVHRLAGERRGALETLATVAHRLLIAEATSTARVSRAWAPGGAELQAPAQDPRPP